MASLNVCSLNGFAGIASSAPSTAKGAPGTHHPRYGHHAQSSQDVYRFEGENSFDFYDDEKTHFEHDSDEDTEDASETDMVKHKEEYTELKEQMYQEKLSNLKKQLQLLKQGLHPDHNKRLKRLEQTHKERMRLCEIFYKYEMECVEREYINEKKAAAREFEEKKIELRENLLVELEDKKRNVENERLTMEFTGDSMEVKTVTTRKLRRRPNDPPPMPEKRRKTSPAQLNYLLDESQILEDLRMINKEKSLLFKKPVLDRDYFKLAARQENLYDARIEDGKLYYDKRWFHRGQSVYIDSKETGKFSGVVSALGTSEIYVRKTTDHSKFRVHLSLLQKGKYTIRRRST